MKYTSRDGSSKSLHDLAPLVKRSISFTLLDPPTWSEHPFLEIVWKHAGYLCEEVKLREVYHAPAGWIAHNYDLFFRVGNGLIQGGAELNALMARIEADAKQRLNIDMKGRGHARPEQTSGPFQLPAMGPLLDEQGAVRQIEAELAEKTGFRVVVAHAPTITVPDDGARDVERRHKDGVWRYFSMADTCVLNLWSNLIHLMWRQRNES